MIQYQSNNHVTFSGYLLEKRVPSIVEGTTKMVDTDRYFTDHSLESSFLRLDLVCNNSDNLHIAVGYKRPSEALCVALNPLKEITLWSGEDLFSEYKS
ncbi:MAG: hypothetical protein U9O98_02605 [Asgard group archaeon]|nr:hypothetical protein [Asgard group archaeon]